MKSHELRKSGLCGKCKNKIFTMMVRSCKEGCGRETNSSYKRCAKCAIEKEKCSFCDGRLRIPKTKKKTADPTKKACDTKKG